MIVTCDRRIYEIEEKYLNETPTGNVVKGWEGYIDGKVTGQARKALKAEDRIFSGASYSMYCSLPHADDGDEDKGLSKAAQKRKTDGEGGGGNARRKRRKKQYDDEA